MPICKKCVNKMHKAGGGMSGTRKCQRYACKNGHTWLNTKELFKGKD